MRVIAAIVLVGLALVASTRANHNDNDDDNNNGRPRRTYITLYKKGECVDDTATGHTQFYYINSAPYSITVSINRNGNRMMPGAYNQGQPTVFLPGQHDAHNVTFSCEPGVVGILQWIVPENNVDHRAIATCSQVPCKPLCCDSVQTIFAGPGIGVAFSGRNATITNTAPQNPLDISSIVAGAGISVARSGSTVTVTNSAQENSNDVANIIAGAGVSASRSGNDVTLALSNPYVGACAVDTCPPSNEDCKESVCIQLSQTEYACAESAVVGCTPGYVTSRGETVHVDTLPNKFYVDAPRMSATGGFHTTIMLEARYHVVRSQTTYLQVSRAANGNLRLINTAPSLNVSDLAPKINSYYVGSNPTAPYLTPATVYEEVWLSYLEETNENRYLRMRVTSVAADGRSFTTASIEPHGTATSSLPAGTLPTNFFAFTSDVAAVYARLEVVRITPVLFSASVGGMDNQGRAIVRAKLTSSLQGPTSGYPQLFVMLAERNPVDGTFTSFLPVTTSGSVISTIDRHNMAEWTVTGLKAGYEYTALVGEPLRNLIILLTQPRPLNDSYVLRAIGASNVAFQTTRFRMPYDDTATNDVRFSAASSNSGPVERALRGADTKNFDFHVWLGDSIVADYSNNSMIDFYPPATSPNNIHLTFGFDPVAYHIRYQILGTTQPVVPVTITNARTFNVDDLVVIFNAGTYNTLTDLAAGFQTALNMYGTNSFAVDTVSIAVNVTVLRVTLLRVSGYGYGEMYMNLMRGDAWDKFAASTGTYSVADDREVYNNFQALTLASSVVGTAREVSIVTAVNAPTSPLRIGGTFVYGMNAPTAYVLPSSAATAVPPSPQWIDAALAMNDRYTQSRFAGQLIDSAALGDGRSGFVRWGQVEIIKLTSLPDRDPVTGLYTYHELASNARMAPAQLAFLTQRLTLSTALVKIVVFSRSLAPNFFDRDDIATYRADFIAAALAATTLSPPATAAEAGAVFDKVFLLNQAGRSGSNVQWLDNVLIPAVKSTNATNVFFMSAGDNLPSAAYLDAQKTIVELQVGSTGTPVSGSSATGAKVGMNRGVIANSRFNGYCEVTVSPTKRTLTFDMVNVQNEKTAVVFALQ